MTNELYIENYHADLLKDEPALITFSIADIKDFSSVSTSWSKTIILPGTASNNKILGNIFEIGQTNSYNNNLPNIGYNFNASRSATCLIFQNNIQAFKGVLRLLQITVDNGRIEYEVAVFGELHRLNVALSSALLEDLDFSEYDHLYNPTNITNSWDHIGESYYYPMIDYGNYSVNKHDWDIRTFRPGLFVKEYIDKLFAAANFRYVSDLFETDRFKRLIIPHNQKNLTGIGSNLATGRINTPYNVIDGPSNATLVIDYDFFSGTNFVYNFTYTGTTPITVRVYGELYGSYRTLNNGLLVGFRKNGTILDSRLFSNTGTNTYNYDFQFNVMSLTLVTGDKVEMVVRYDGITSDDDMDDFISANSGYMIVAVQEGTSVVNINPGDTVQLNSTIPRNIRQVDFLTSIVKLWNLYVVEDREEPGLMHITPYVDFYKLDESAIDWTYKLDRSKLLTIQPMSEVNAKVYKFNYKQDSDYYNDLYFKRFSQTYGSYTFDSEFEFAERENKLELIFAGTPLVGYTGEEKVYSTIFKRNGEGVDAKEEQTDSVIRILQTKLILGVTPWVIKDGATTIQPNIVGYGYAGHLNDPDAPSNDLNFGALQLLFFTLVSGNLSNTQFNIYWSAYMAEITDKDSKLITGNFVLRVPDIFNLDFARLIMLDGILFRLNKISDYNINGESGTMVELLKVNNLIY